MGARRTVREPEDPEEAPHSVLRKLFLAHLSHERGLSPHTTENYGRDIEKLCRLAGGTALKELNTPHIRQFLGRLRAQQLAPRSMARALSAWRTFFRYLIRDHGHTRNPCQGLRAPKAGKRLPKSLSPDEASRLMEIQADDDVAIRDRAILELFYSSGLRLSELTSLTLDQLGLDEGVVRVTGKGNKTRIVPVGTQAQSALHNWLIIRPSFLRSETRCVFLGTRGKGISPSTVQARLAYWSKQMALGRHVHPHMLRHSFASHVLQSSGDLRAVQEMLGHASISSTQVYTHLDFQHLAKVYDAAHPRAKKKGVGKKMG